MSLVAEWTPGLSNTILRDVQQGIISSLINKGQKKEMEKQHFY